MPHEKETNGRMTLFIFRWEFGFFDSDKGKGRRDLTVPFGFDSAEHM